MSTQYSYLPSWITFLIDHTASAPAGSILFNAVYQEWARRPVTARPKLLVFGESLGSHGGNCQGIWDQWDLLAGLYFGFSGGVVDPCSGWHA